MDQHAVSAHQDDSAETAALLDMIYSGWVSQAVYVAAKLGIADALDGGARTSADVAAAVGADADGMQRLLRGLASLDLVREQEGGLFALTALGRRLQTGVRGSLRSCALHWGGTMWPVWGGLFHQIKTGRNPRALVTRKDAFESLAQQSSAARTFNEAMSEVSALIAAGVVRHYDFSGITRLVDIGGGHGLLLASILRAHPALQGVLFDQPHVVDGASAYLEDAGVAGRCEVVPGSFFESVPAGGDAYMLKSVLHDWDDEQSRVILGHCRRVMPPDGRLLVIERLLPERVEPSQANRLKAASDLGMMVAISGRERSAPGLRALLTSAGFTVTHVVDTVAYYSVVEARCA